ncbi:MAG: hydrogenase iron-sulfur subunit [Dehalococcoidia bacterium]
MVNRVSSQNEVAATAIRVTIFRCATHPRPAASKADDPAHPQPLLMAQEIALPCSGRLQPAHLLKAFEAGADAVCVITCAGADCLYLEGGLRLERRVQYVRGLLDEIGLGGERLLLFELPTETQRENSFGPNGLPEEIAAKLAAVGPSPLRQNGSRRTE